jgi:hypothetical protein
MPFIFYKAYKLCILGSKILSVSKINNSVIKFLSFTFFKFQSNIFVITLLKWMNSNFMHVGTYFYETKIRGVMILANFKEF